MFLTKFKKEKPFDLLTVSTFWETIENDKSHAAEKGGIMWQNKGKKLKKVNVEDVTLYLVNDKLPGNQGMKNNLHIMLTVFLKL